MAFRAATARQTECMILLLMQDGKTERSNCSFTVQQTSDGKPILVVQFTKRPLVI
jgi:hypothetical protein